MAKPPALRTDGPNQFPNALNAAHRAELGVTCRFLGKTYYKDQEICWEGEVWVCDVAGWRVTDEKC